MTLESLHGESVIVTRGSSGIGRATALLFVEHGSCMTNAGIEGRFGYTLEARNRSADSRAREVRGRRSVAVQQEMARLIWLLCGAQRPFRSG